MLSSHHARRAIGLLVIVQLTGCTSLKVVPISELEHRHPLKGTYVITTRDDQVIKTDRLAVEDSVLVIDAVIVDSRRRDVQPFTIPYENVASISQERTNWIVLTGVIAGLTACVIAIGSVLADIGPIGK